MARTCNIDNAKQDFLAALRKAIQSANLNFLIGSGCSVPAIPVLGNIEKIVEEYNKAGKTTEADKQIFEFLSPFLKVSNQILNTPEENVAKTLESYKSFLTVLSQVLFERKNNLLPRQASIFTTNYELFFEKAFEGIKTLAKLNDGFVRLPSLTGSFQFSSSEFFNSTYNNGNLYSYQVPIPAINLVKLHGSLSWKTDSNQIIFHVDNYQELISKYEKLSKEGSPEDISKFNTQFSFILPTKDKFRDTILNQTYYDLLRLYANELDKENTLLLVDGFSFEDEHIFEITKRGLKNPTLKIIIFCHTAADLAGYNQKFSSYNNVDIVYSASKEIDFQLFSTIIKEVLPADYKADPVAQPGETHE